MRKYACIEAVLKIAERCNINCTYCYMFNKESDLFETKPKYISLETVRAVAKFLLDGAIQSDAHTVRVIFHGGEPMMVRPAFFDQICSIFVEELVGHVGLQFSIQTNATLVSDAWILMFEKYQVGVGVSLDGPKHVNDVHRVDHRGRGTHDRVARGSRRLQEAFEQGRLAGPPGALCVVDPDQDGAETFRHLVTDMGFKAVDFLLPIETRETMPPRAAERIGAYLTAVFQAWNEHGDKSVSVRFFDNFYMFMTGYNRRLSRALDANDGNVCIITISTDGSFGPDDTLRIVSDEYFSFDCRRTTLAEFERDPAIAEILQAAMTPPLECAECAWAACCLGGSAHGRVVNRYSKAEGFGRKSILCEGLLQVYAVQARALIDSGYSPDSMFERLDKAADGLFEAARAQQ